MTSKCLGLACRTTARLESLRGIDVPIFLCPALLKPGYYIPKERGRTQEASFKSTQQLPRRSLHSKPPLTRYEAHSGPVESVMQLPQHCAGCGALAQSLDRQEPGFYSLSRRSVKAFLTGTAKPITAKRPSKDQLIEACLQRADVDILKNLQLDVPAAVQYGTQQSTPPMCDRCHKLLHHQVGESIHHPSIESIQDTILESPYKHNHIYHVIDAADFPMSVIPGLYRRLNLMPQRSLNRRSKTEKFYHGKKTEVSFIITRSDLLAPLKTQVDSLMPRLVSILRGALGSFGRDVRLGNVRCVSAKRGWWTKELKEDIWTRGGGGWMVGKVNVGKSQLFDSVFPKGRRGAINMDNVPSRVAQPEELPMAINGESLQDAQVGDPPDYSSESREDVHENKTLGPFSLLPPLRPETDYPVMPLVSALPGTTASPIRVPFGNGKGELVDLPGLSRGDLELFVQAPHRSALVMRSRIVPEQQVIKSGQSLLLGGFIRITPVTKDAIFLAYAFTPISSHLTSTEKAITIQTQATDSGVENIANLGVGEIIKSAGKFSLRWDVTKQRSGPITANDALGIKVDKLPYKVLSTDILIEGCGWIELVVQVRRKNIESKSESLQVVEEPEWPEVEVFTPDGRFIATREPLGAWSLGGQKIPAAKMKGRPRKSMKGVKKRMKVLRRTTES